MTASTPDVLISLAFTFVPKFWAITFFIVIIAKQVIRKEQTERQGAVS